MARILIVGGASGVGRASALGFRARGDDVAMVDNRDGAPAVATIQSTGRALLVNADPADPAVPSQAVEQAIAFMGGIDALLIASALMISAPLSDWTVAMWDRSLALNLRAPFLFVQAALSELKKSPNPSVTFISSTAALRGQAGAAAYQASRAGLGGLCRGLTAELTPLGIRINCVLPGWIEPAPKPNMSVEHSNVSGFLAAIDENIPLGRHGTAEEAAAIVLFLASPAARYVAGASIIVDGGFTAI
jgi:NAD(P)-dependent dehydrogenase (short-subunit alcohol dehydrogenase family)